MCRLYGQLSNEPTKVDCSLVFSQNALMQQSRADETGRDHTDGWGIASYPKGKPVALKKSTAAYSDIRFSTAAEGIYSTAIIAHVRRATVGANAIRNTHPFVFEHWAFAHNGTVTGFQQIRQQLESETCPKFQAQRRGETDSEQFFLWLVSRLSDADCYVLSSSDVASDAKAVLQRAVSDLARRCEATAPAETPRLNFILTDGNTMLVCRWNNSLHLIRREGLYDCEICGIPHVHHHETVNHRAVAFASEPVTHEAWEEVSNHSMMAVSFRFPVT